MFAYTKPTMTDVRIATDRIRGEAVVKLVIRVKTSIILLLDFFNKDIKILAVCQIINYKDSLCFFVWYERTFKQFLN